MKLYGKEIQSKICSKNLDKDGLVDLMMQYSRWIKGMVKIMWGELQPILEL